MDTFIVTWPDWTALRSLQATLALRRKLSEAAVVRPEAVPPDVVTMNSRFLCHADDPRDARVVTLCFPSEAFRRPGRLSISTPVGTAVLGACTGQTVVLQQRTFRIGDVLYQPERVRYSPLPVAP